MTVAVQFEMVHLRGVHHQRANHIPWMCRLRAGDEEVGAVHTRGEDAGGGVVGVAVVVVDVGEDDRVAAG